MGPEAPKGWPEGRIRPLGPARRSQALAAAGRFFMLCAMASSQGEVVPRCGRELGWSVTKSRIWTVCWRNASTR